MKKRSDIPVEFTWNMEDMFPSDEAWKELYRETEKRLPDYQNYKGKLADSAESLYQCLLFDDECSLAIERLFVYARQKSDEDTGKQIYQELTGKAQLLANRAAELSSFLIPEILSMDETLLSGYLKSDCGIAHYRKVIERVLDKKAHTLSVEMEELLAQSLEATQGASQIFNMFNNADLKFPEIQVGGENVRITHGNYIKLMENQDRTVRQNAFFALYGSYKSFINTLASTFSANVKQAVFYAKARHYSSSRAYALAENEIPENVYDQLIAAVHDRMGLMHHYAALRRRALGVEELHMYDLYVPMVADYDRSYTYEEAKAMVLEGLAPLGDHYLSLLKEGFRNRWIDVYENEGKRSGAYSWGAYGTHPYVLLNFSGTLDHVFTLAHEMGHALHSWHSDQNQPYTYAGYKIFVAEVASTCNEALLIRHMLDKAENEKEEAYLINHFLESFRGTLFRQTMFAEFEAIVHRKAAEGEPLTAESLCGIYRRLNVEYFGPDMVVDHEIHYEWARIPHFYTPFYVYQYATGFSAAVAISSRILAGDQGTLDGYVKFLSGGCSMTPIELLKLCGVDMSTSKPVGEALAVFEGLLDRLETLI